MFPLLEIEDPLFIFGDTSRTITLWMELKSLTILNTGIFMCGDLTDQKDHSLDGIEISYHSKRRNFLCGELTNQKDHSLGGIEISYHSKWRIFFCEHLTDQKDHFMGAV